MDLPHSNTETPVFCYTRIELATFRKKTSLLSLSIVDCLKDLNIGCHFPRLHRSSRGVKRNIIFLHPFVVVVDVVLPQAPEDDSQKR